MGGWNLDELLLVEALVHDCFSPRVVSHWVVWRLLLGDLVELLGGVEAASSNWLLEVVGGEEFAEGAYHATLHLLHHWLMRRKQIARAF